MDMDFFSSLMQRLLRWLSSVMNSAVFHEEERWLNKYIPWRLADVLAEYSGLLNYLEVHNILICVQLLLMMYTHSGIYRSHLYGQKRFQNISQQTLRDIFYTARFLLLRMSLLVSLFHVKFRNNDLLPLASFIFHIFNIPCTVMSVHKVVHQTSYDSHTSGVVSENINMIQQIEKDICEPPDTQCEIVSHDTSGAGDDEKLVESADVLEGNEQDVPMSHEMADCLESPLESSVDETQKEALSSQSVVSSRTAMAVCGLAIPLAFFMKLIAARNGLLSVEQNLSTSLVSKRGEYLGQDADGNCKMSGRSIRNNFTLPLIGLPLAGAVMTLGRHISPRYSSLLASVITCGLTFIPAALPFTQTPNNKTNVKRSDGNHGDTSPSIKTPVTHAPIPIIEFDIDESFSEGRCTLFSEPRSLPSRNRMWDTDLSPYQMTVNWEKSPVTAFITSTPDDNVFDDVFKFNLNV